jgi:hypothetical protein
MVADKIEKCWNGEHELEIVTSSLTGNDYCVTCGAEQTSAEDRLLIEAFVEAYTGF